MIKFMVDLRTSSDAAAVAGIEELREVVAALGAELGNLTGNVSSDRSADLDLTPGPKRTTRKKAGE